MLHRELEKRAAEGNPIRVGASARAWMGSGFVTQMFQTPGMELTVLANPDTEEACQMFIDMGVDSGDVVEANAVGVAMDALRSGKRVITGALDLPAQLEDVDIVTDATWSPAAGAEVAQSCIDYGKDVVLINIEADVTVGRILKKKAAEADVLYSVSSGDEPGCLMELYDFVRSLGMEVIVIGKGKNNPLNPQATPEAVAESAKKADKDPFQVASYVDGTKTMFEMSCAANATGCLPIQRSMTGPEADLTTVSQIFALQEDGGRTPQPNTVDFVQGSAMSGGVFVTVRINNERIADDLNYLKVGKGKYFTFFRPYHLWFIEAPISIAKAYLSKTVTLAPLDEPVADVMTIAKRDLNPGDILDDFGGYTTYGVMDRAEISRELNALPVGLTPNAKVKQTVKAGKIVTWDDVELDESSVVVKLRREQDQLDG